MKTALKNHILARQHAALIFALLMILISCQQSNNPDGVSGASLQISTNGNSLFYQEGLHQMQAGALEVSGEVTNPGMVDLKKIYTRELVLREMINESGNDVFIGAYRYVGYSLHDLLHPFLLEKKNKDAFRPQTDAYILIENENGEQVTFSWSEIFHSSQPHQVMIAVGMAPVVPHKKEVEYPVAQNWRLVAGGDLYARRQLENPVSIRVISFDQKDYAVNREISPLYSNSLNVFMGDEMLMALSPSDAESHPFLHYNSCFYGMGMGYHPIAEGFTGPSLKSIMQQKINFSDPDLLRNGLVCFAGLDGYRAVYSFSELFNRTDQLMPILAVSTGEGGHFRNFLSTDFYADRSVKSLQEIYFFKP